MEQYNIGDVEVFPATIPQHNVYCVRRGDYVTDPCVRTSEC